MLSILAIVVAVMAYCAVAGLAHPYLAEIQAAKCDNCRECKPYSINRGRIHYEDCLPGDFHSTDTIVHMLLWPLSLPYTLTTARDPMIKRNRQNIRQFHEDRAMIQAAERTKKLEKELL